LGLSHLKTVERRKIKSGSSAARAGAAGHNSHPANTKSTHFGRMSYRLMALNGIVISGGRQRAM
jgi:hypothetical protein